jgi:outer membrane murein-binding lipoprotein Lpp
MGENKNSKNRKELKMTYSNSIAGSRQKYSTRNQNSTSFRDQARTLGPISNTIILIVLACLLGLLYLTQVTKTNTFSYQINSLETQQTQLQTQHDQLEIDATRLQSIERVASSPTTQQLASITPTVTIKN